MNAFPIKPITAGLLLLATIPSGIWLSRKGKPYNTGIFTIHKLIAVAAVVLIGMSIYDLHSIAGLWTSIVISVFALTALLYLAMVATGALLSLNVSLHGITLRIHQAAPTLVFLSTTYIIYTLISTTL